ncbi:ABC transporter G family member 24-like [Dendronephthya gigantea]|uniref:ABC transporter G family member 24-like n=1 Tax=Dendronephthya gigantea TaxID=151771 RepID=UPI00106A1364|nr:ABC transporter G family member 24-like [Dendronephthya gigantea]
MSFITYRKDSLHQQILATRTRSNNMKGKSCFVTLFVILSIQWSRQESLCGKNARAPPGGCCPKRFSADCCPFAGDNETILPCEDRPTSSTSSSRGLLGGHLFDPRTACVHSWKTQACAGGFFLNSTTGKPQPCPRGFFCPHDLLCIIPCPSGAYCIPKKRYNETEKMKCNGLGVCCGKNDPPLIMNITGGKKCNSIKDENCACGGTSKPEPCPGGYYCPTTDVKIECSSGHYCRPGSVQPDPCPWLTDCDRGSSAPIANFIAPLLNLIVLIIFICLVLLYRNKQTVKFYWGLYFVPRKGRERSSTRSFHVNEAIAHSTIKLGNLGDMDDTDEDIKPKSYTIDISFENLGLTLKTAKDNGKVVLSGVTGHINSGEVTAVMGPSGAGKTTFLNTLSGKAYYGNARGQIMFNNKLVKGVKKLRTITGFVPQEDTMHRNLTVREVLFYQAKLRLPEGTDSNTIDKKIHQTLHILEILQVADSLIGDEEARGISGGQRKRVNIGMELIADPTLLFLDEPTSGLDSTSSLSVLKSLRAVAEHGKLTVLCVIHQPRFEIFEMFHNILLLGKGGKTVYQGTVPGAADYFSSLGFKTPANVNPADFYMDVIGGSVNEKDIDLFEAWNKNFDEGTASKDRRATLSCCGDEVTRALPNPFCQFVTFTRREFLLQLRLVKTLFIDVFLVFFAGGVLGALYLEVSLRKFTALTRMSGMAIGLTSMLSSLRCFGNHRTTFWRESAAGVNRVSYFLAVNFAQLPILALMPLVYLSLLYTLTSPRSYFSAHYAGVFCAQLCCSGIGYAISTIFNPKSSQMASVVVVLVMAMVSGSSPTLCKLDELKFFGPLGYNLSYIRWFVEAMFEKEALRYPDVVRPVRDAIAFSDHYSLDDNYAFCLGMMIFMAVVYRVIALLFLLFTNRGKQQ